MSWFCFNFKAYFLNRVYSMSVFLIEAQYLTPITLKKDKLNMAHRFERLRADLVGPRQKHYY